MKTKEKRISSSGYQGQIWQSCQIVYWQKTFQFSLETKRSLVSIAIRNGLEADGHR